MDKKYSSIISFAKEKIYKNAPLKVSNDDILKEAKLLYNIDDLKIKYPYKPFLILSIIWAYQNKEEELLSKQIYLNDDAIVKNFYNLITNDYLLYKILGVQKSKNDWTEIGFNNNIKTKVFNIMLSGPISHLESKWFKYDNNTRYLWFDFGDIQNPVEAIKYLELLTINILKKIIPWYSNLDKSSIQNISEYDYMNLYINQIDDIIKNDAIARKYQHEFRKFILDRDQKCVICCIDNNAVLEACHIKPYSRSLDNEKYDINNGITMCSNHHKLFDKGLFTFNDSWKVIISNSVIVDDYLFFKQYETNCYSNTLSRFANMNIYLKYHRNHIFNKH